jgi:hypothetical protein
MKRTVFSDSITVFFALLFLYTGLIKLMEIQTFRQQLSASPFLGPLSSIVTWILPIGEILLSIALLIPKWRLKGLYATFVVMAIFTSYVCVISLSGNKASCNCGGIIEDLTMKQHILFNSSCLILSAIGILIVRRQQPTVQFQWLTASSSAGLLIVVGWLLITAFRAPAVRITGLEGRTLPDINLQLPDSITYFNTAEIPVGKPFIVIAFDPWCKHCQELTTDIVDHIQEFKDTHIYYISPFDFNKMGIFYRYFELKKFSNVIFGRDTANVFLPYFQSSLIPFVAIFDSKKRLQTVIGGQMNAAQIARLVQN